MGYLRAYTTDVCVERNKRMREKIHKSDKEKRGFLVGIKGKEAACQCRRCRRWGFDPWVGRSPVGGRGIRLQSSCLENPLDRGTWWATVHRIAKSWTWLKRLSRHACKKTLLQKMFCTSVSLYFSACVCVCMCIHKETNSFLKKGKTNNLVSM